MKLRFAGIRTHACKLIIGFCHHFATKRRAGLHADKVGQQQWMGGRSASHDVVRRNTTACRAIRMASERSMRSGEVGHDRNQALHYGGPSSVLQARALTAWLSEVREGTLSVVGVRARAWAS